MSRSYDMRVLLVILLFSSGISFSQNETADSISVQQASKTDTCYVNFSWYSDQQDASKTAGGDSSSVSDGNFQTIFLVHVLDCYGEFCSFNIQPECQVLNYTVRIYNRWGEVLFESTNPGDVWCPYGNAEGVYIWQVEGTYPSGETFKRHGHVTLLNYPRSE